MKENSSELNIDDAIYYEVVEEGTGYKAILRVPGYDDEKTFWGPTWLRAAAQAEAFGLGDPTISVVLIESLSDLRDDTLNDSDRKRPAITLSTNQNGSTMPKTPRQQIQDAADSEGLPLSEDEINIALRLVAEGRSIASALQQIRELRAEAEKPQVHKKPSI